MIIGHLLLAAGAAAYTRPVPGLYQQQQQQPAATPVTSRPPADERSTLATITTLASGTSAPGADLWGPRGQPAPLGPSGASEYQLNLGRAIDTLRVDHPRLFTHAPDLSIFTPEVTLRDTSGVTLRGLDKYERVFGMLRFMKRAALQHVELTHRLVVSDRTIRMRWTCKLWLRDPNLDLFPGMGSIQAKLAYVDGVSVYSLNEHGLIYSHRLENVVLRNSFQGSPVANLQFAWPGAQQPVPELARPYFRLLGPALSAGIHGLFESSLLDDDDTGAVADADGPAGRARKGRRHGVPYASASIEPEETPMVRAAREQAEMAAERAALTELRKPAKEQKRAAFPFNPFSSESGSPQQCESSYDCDSPLVCCDLIITSVCCSGGMLIPTKSAPQRMQEQMIPIPVERNRPAPGGGGGMPPNYPRD